EFEGGDGGKQARRAVGADRQPVDLLEAARAVGKEALAMGGGTGRGTFLLPRRSVGLPRHVGQRIEAVLRLELDLVDRLVARAPALFSEPSLGARRSRG